MYTYIVMILEKILHTYTLCLSIVLDYDEDLSAVYEETAEVVHWYTLGIFLHVVPSELERIAFDYRFSREGLQRMLSLWLKGGHATWSSLVCALNKMGEESLGCKIAAKKGE